MHRGQTPSAMLALACGGELAVAVPLISLACAGGDRLKSCVFPMRRHASILAVGVLLGVGLAGSLGAAQPLREWTFDSPGDLEGWRPNADVTEVVVTNGVLRCRAVGSDPILELSSLLDIEASPWQVIELRLKADRNGEAEVFYSNTATGRYGGFAQEKTVRFAVVGDGQWRTYRLLPGWHPEGRIVRLRLDVYDGAQFELDSLRLVALSVPPPSPERRFDFSQEARGWQWIETRSAPAHSPSAGGTARSTPTGLLLSPPLDLNGATHSFVSVRMTVDRGQFATLFFITEAGRGFPSFPFAIEADGKPRTYVLDMLEAAEWRGRVLGLGLQPTEVADAVVALHSLTVSQTPQGPPQLKVHSFAIEDALPRAGVPATLAAVIENHGGPSASPLEVALQLPAGVRLVTNSASPGSPLSLGFGEEARLNWAVQADEPALGEAELSVSAGRAEPITASASLRFTPRLAVPDSGYVPVPQPVRGPFEVGVYYFPGWKSASQWHPIQRFPKRRPVLGWYREGEPEVADWHIKWAVEHGITFFAYDWYWTQGARQLEHALHDGYFHARYRHLLKFCLLWANHNPPGSSSPEDCLAVTRHWIEHYFHRSEHLLVGGKPVVIIFSPHRLTEDLGSSKVKEAFAAMREECQRAGFPGLHLIACVGDAGEARRAAAEGYDAVTAYTWPHLGMGGGGKAAPFATLVEGYRRHWELLYAESLIPLNPLPVSGGWDSRPWHGLNNLVRFGRTPELFRQHLRDARRFLEAQPSGGTVPPAVLIEAWNEWGEGSYIEPHQEFGFGYLDALREVFADAPEIHEDVTPADAGLGPYEVLPLSLSTNRWEFEKGDDGWDNHMQLAEVHVADGVLVARTAGNDAAFFGPPMQARASAFGAVLVRLRLTRKDGERGKDNAQLFWRTARLTESESTSQRLTVQIDGQWHEYRIPVAQNPRWRGVITRLRLDPVNQANVTVELDYVRLTP
jgi:hypothetical protein